MKNPRIFFLFLIFLVSISCNRPLSYQIQKSAISSSGMVVSAHPLATNVGLQILQQGGNAVDAAVAVQFALAVVCPRAGNIGGGGFLVYRGSTGNVASLDFREKAPALASRDMYLDQQGNIIQGKSTEGHLAVGIPGSVDGLVTTHKKLGQLPWKALVQPSVNLARKGFKISVEEADRLNTYQSAFKKYHASNSPFLKANWKPGNKLTQKDLARVLERIRDQGRAGFYEGETADLIVREMKKNQGLISHEDLKAYFSVWREPIISNYKNYRFISMPPSSSGGVAIGQMLGMLEGFPISEWGFESPESIHLIVEIERRAFADRAKFLGDSDFYAVPIDSLLAEDYLKARISDFDMERASTSSTIGAGDFKSLPESFETTHTSVVDPWGNAVALTTTLNSNYGSKVLVEGGGFFLNNEMDDFSSKPGTPNQFGLIGAEANAIEPGKRMLSSMTPTIIEKDGELYLVLGTPGGSTIITSVLQVFLNMAEFGMDLEQAIAARRFHHQWLPDHIMIEKEKMPIQLINKLKEKGHNFREVDFIGKVKAIHRLPNGRLHGVGDPRNGDDDAKGY